MTGVGASDITGDMGMTLAKLRRDNALADVVHDPEEDEPKVVGIPKRYQQPTPTPAVSPTEPPVSFWRRLVNRLRPT